MNCETCQFWRPNNHYKMGQCTRRAPTAREVTVDEKAAQGYQHARAVWPETRANEGCGEWKIKP